MRLTRSIAFEPLRVAPSKPESELSTESRGSVVTIGVYVYAGSAVVLGLVGLVAGDFADVWQPVPTALPGRTLLAYLTAIVLIASGIGLVWRRSARASAVALALLYLVFAILWLPRVAAYPRVLGTWNGVFEQLALVAAATTYFAALAAPNDAGAAWLQQLARLLFGVCLLSFGATHFDALPQTAELVPPWLPPSPVFWAAATGVFHIAAGLAILSHVRAVLAARLFTAMLITFGVLVWAPRLVANAQVHRVWSGNAINFALIGAAWLMADSIASMQRQRLHARASVMSGRSDRDPANIRFDRGH
jgi:uncharacterized membrane protein YphA (DoxX/SURF4 family)